MLRNTIKWIIAIPQSWHTVYYMAYNWHLYSLMASAWRYTVGSKHAGGILKQNKELTNHRYSDGLIFTPVSSMYILHHIHFISYMEIPEFLNCQQLSFSYVLPLPSHVHGLQRFLWSDLLWPCIYVYCQWCVVGTFQGWFACNGIQTGQHQWWWNVV